MKFHSERVQSQHKALLWRCLCFFFSVPGAELILKGNQTEHPALLEKDLSQKPFNYHYFPEVEASLTGLSD